MASNIVRYYRPAYNPDRAFLPGVPLRDLTEDEYTTLPKWLQAQVDAQKFYQNTAPNKAAREADEEMLRNWQSQDAAALPLQPAEPAPVADEAQPAEPAKE